MLCTPSDAAPAPDAARGQLLAWTGEIEQLDAHLVAAGRALSGMQICLGLAASRQLMRQPEGGIDCLNTYCHMERVQENVQLLRDSNRRYATVLSLMEVAWKWIDAGTLKMTQTMLTQHIVEVQAMLAHIQDVTDTLPQLVIQPA